MRNLPQWLKGVVVFALSFQVAACGTLMHPERKGQKDGNLDVGVVILDGIGLLFFIIPGIICYAVDLSNGTIYLPGTGKIKTVKFDPKNYSPDMLRTIIRQETGYNMDWQDKRLQVIKLQDKNELPAYFAQARTAQAGSNLVSSR